jgi:hypothetical protein
MGHRAAMNEVIAKPDQTALGQLLVVFVRADTLGLFRAKERQECTIEEPQQLWYDQPITAFETVASSREQVRPSAEGRLLDRPSAQIPNKLLRKSSIPGLLAQLSQGDHRAESCEDLGRVAQAMQSDDAVILFG